MYITGKTDNRTFGYEIYFTSPKLLKQFDNANLDYDEFDVDKFQRSLEALYTLSITDAISDELFRQIRADISKKINEHLCKHN